MKKSFYPIFNNIFQPICRAVFGARPRRNGVDPAVPLGILGKMVSHWPFEDSGADAWGCAPITQAQEISPTYGNSVDYGPGPGGRCLVSGRIKSNPIMISPASQETTTVAMFNTTTFNNGASTFGFTDGSTPAIHFSEGNDGDAKWNCRAVTAGFANKTITTPTNLSVNSWYMMGLHVNPGVGSNLHFSDTYNYGSLSWSDAQLSGLYAQVGQVSGAVGTSSKMAFITFFAGSLTEAEWQYYYNSGTPKTLSEMIADSEYVRPTMRFDTQIASNAIMAASYDGRRVASQQPDLTGNRVRTNNSITAGLRYITFRFKRALQFSANTTAVGLLSEAAGTNGVYVQCGFSSGSVGAFGSGFTVNDATSWAGNVGADDYITIAVNQSTGKGWFGKNGTMDGNPVAGTGQNFTFAPGTTLYPYIYTDDHFTHAAIGMVTADMPHTITGFSAWAT